MTDTSAIEWIRGWVSTGALIGLLTLASRLWLQNRKLSMQAKIDDRQGYGSIIDHMAKEIGRLSDRVDELERGKDMDHKLIIGLLAQLNRNQAAAILASQNVSPELRAALDATMGDAGRTAQ